ncbi:MAG: phage holin family protein [Opitutales bacterium]|nr:phage holin family protein [Opitutales bacterium]MCH8541486.1 phage holin family protein [Opitutales bacterium]
MRSLSLLGSTAAHLVAMRVRLLAAEFHLERMRFLRCLFLSVLGGTLLGTALLAATALIVLSVSEENQIMVLGIIVLVLLGMAALCIGFTLHYLFGASTPFQASTDALKEDGKCLTSLLNK